MMGKLLNLELYSETGNRICTKKYCIYNVLKDGTVVAKIEKSADNYNKDIDYYSVCTVSEKYSNGEYVGRYDTLIQARVGVTEYFEKNPIIQKPKVKALYLPADENNEFYPTPSKLAGMMLSDIDWTYIETILEPTAGKGDLADYAKKAAKGRKRRYDRWKVDVDCIEIDSNLRLG